MPQHVDCCLVSRSSINSIVKSDASNNNNKRLSFIDLQCYIMVEALNQFVSETAQTKPLLDIASQLLHDCSKLCRNVNFTDMIRILEIHSDASKHRRQVVEMALREHILSADPECADLACVAFRKLCNNE